MKKILSLIIIGILASSNLFGQINIDILSILERKNFYEFKKFADSLVNKDKIGRHRWTFLRDLTSNFQEGIFIFENNIFGNTNYLQNKIDYFQVNIISSNERIVFYNLGLSKKEESNGKWKNYLQSIIIFKNNELYDSLANSFKMIFNSALDSNDLFLNEFMYGHSCGFGGHIKPFGREKLNEWVKQKNKTELLSWLTSANTEKQFYAIEGLLRLRKEDFILTEFEKKIIKFIIKKEGTIQTCNGCTFGTEPIKSYKKFFKL